MKNDTRFYIGGYDGVIGHTEGGYPIHNSFLIAVLYKDEWFGDTWDKVYQVREMKGIVNEAGKWEELQPIQTRTAPVYKLGEITISEDKLITRYEVTDVTKIVLAINDIVNTTDDAMKKASWFPKLELNSFKLVDSSTHPKWGAIKAVQAKLVD